MGTFADQIAGFAKLAKEQQTRIFRRAVELLAAEMNVTGESAGFLNHRTGNAMRSQRAQINRIIQMGPPGAEYASEEVGQAVADALLSDEIFVGWQANYVHRLNFGFVGQDSLGRNINQPGRHFVERAAQMWPELVKRAAREVNEG